jgi:hypothetical protein
MDTKDQELIVFLRDIANSIEDDSIEPYDKQRVGEFYMQYKFKNMINDINSSDIDEKDMIKFLVLGWYIYCVVLKNKQAVDYEGEEVI